VRLFIGLTGASISRRFRCVYSSLLPPLGLVRHVGFAKLKNLSNQVSSSAGEIQYDWTKNKSLFIGMCFALSNTYLNCKFNFPADNP
jgi:hypothetical protein